MPSEHGLTQLDVAMVMMATGTMTAGNVVE